MRWISCHPLLREREEKLLLHSGTGPTLRKYEIRIYQDLSFHYLCSLRIKDHMFPKIFVPIIYAHHLRGHAIGMSFRVVGCRGEGKKDKRRQSVIWGKEANKKDVTHPKIQ